MKISFIATEMLWCLVDYDHLQNFVWYFNAQKGKNKISKLNQHNTCNEARQQREPFTTARNVSTL